MKAVVSAAIKDSRRGNSPTSCHADAQVASKNEPRARRPAFTQIEITRASAFIVLSLQVAHARMKLFGQNFSIRPRRQRFSVERDRPDSLPGQQVQEMRRESYVTPKAHVIFHRDGRIFGPCLYQGKFIYTGAFSRENYDPSAKIKHRYSSFKRARDELSRSLGRNSAFKIFGSVYLKNAIMRDKDNTTGDHDGFAVILSLKQ